MNAKRRIGILALSPSLVFGIDCSMHAQAAGGTITELRLILAVQLFRSSRLPSKTPRPLLMKMVYTSSNGSYQADNLVPDPLGMSNTSPSTFPIVSLVPGVTFRSTQPNVRGDTC